LSQNITGVGRQIVITVIAITVISSCPLQPLHSEKGAPLPTGEIPSDMVLVNTFQFIEFQQLNEIHDITVVFWRYDFEGGAQNDFKISKRYTVLFIIHILVTQVKQYGLR